MARTDSTISERTGVNAVEGIFLNRLKWLFREQPIADFGIDAHVEVTNDGEPTGRLIALQIKSGQSYFSRKNSEGFLYRGEIKHLNYWEQHSLPVFLILHNPQDGMTLWQRIDRRNCNISDRSWSVLVPTTNVLNEEASHQFDVDPIRQEKGGDKFNVKNEATEIPIELQSSFRATPLNSGPYASFGRGIPYYSREDFEAEVAGRASLASVENMEFDEFLHDDDKIAFIISGRGGVGKTRLAEHLLAGLNASGWRVFYLAREVSNHHVTRFLELIAPGFQYCLLIDYAEDANIISNIVSGIHEKMADGQFRVKVVTTCRTSGLFSLENRIWRYQQSRDGINLDQLNKRDHNQYVSWVSQQILKAQFRSEWQAYFKICENTPSVAVFFSYLKAKHDALLEIGDYKRAAAIAEKLKNPAAHRDFQDWVDVQLVKSTGRGSPTGQLYLRDASLRFVRIYTILPQKYSELRDQEFADRLIDDGWLHLSHEPDSNNPGGPELPLVYAPHDTFTEAILQSWLNSYRSDREMIRLREDAFTLILDIAENNRFGQLLRTLNRLDVAADYRHAIILALKELIARGKGRTAISRVIGTFIINRFVPVELKVSALETVATLTNSSVNAVINFALELKEGGHSSASEAFKLVRRLAQQVVTREGPKSNRLLRAFEIFPEMFKDEVAEKLRSEVRSGIGSRLLTQWINAKLPLSDVNEQLNEWFNVHGETRAAGNVLNELLKVPGIQFEYDHRLERWLAATRGGVVNATLPAAGATLFERLRKGGSTEPLRIALARWYECNPSSPWTGSLATYLKAGVKDFAALHTAEEYALRRLDFGNDDGDELNSQMCQLLKVAADTTENSQAGRKVTEWAQSPELYTALSAQRVYSAWLENRGSPSAIRRQLIEFLDRQFVSIQPKATAVGWAILFKNWIRYGDDRQLIIPFVDTWIGHVDFSEFFEGQDFLAEWVRQTSLPIDIVGRQIWDWFSNPKFLEITKARYLIDSIAAYRPDFVDEARSEQFQEAADRWLEPRKGREEAYWVLCDVLSMNLSFHYEDHLTSWLDSFGKENPEKAVRLLHCWLQIKPDDPTLRWYLIAYFSRMIFAAAADARYDKKLIEAWRTSNRPFPRDITTAIHKRLEQENNPLIIWSLISALKEPDRNQPEFIPYFKIVASGWKTDQSRGEEVVACLYCILGHDRRDPWIGDFIDNWLQTASSNLSVNKFSLVCQWKDIDRDPAELLPFLNASAQDSALRLDARIGRPLATWKSYLGDTFEIDPTREHWLQEWIEHNLEYRAWYIGSFLLGLSEYQATFPEFLPLAETWLMKHKDPTWWPDFHKSYFSRIMKLYLSDPSERILKRQILQEIVANQSFPEDEKQLILCDPSVARWLHSRALVD